MDAEGFEGAKRQSWERKKRALCRSPTAGNETLQERVWRGQAAVWEAEKKSTVQIRDSWQSHWRLQDIRWKGHWTLQGRVWRGQAAVLEAEKRLCADPQQLAKSWGKKAVTDLRQLEKPLAFARNRSKGHLTLHVGNRKNELCADLRKLEKPLAFARNRSKGHLTLQTKVWALEPEKRALCRSPPTIETIGICHRTLQGGPGGGLGIGKKSAVQIPDSWQSHWRLQDTGGKATGRCRRGQAAVLEAEKKALCRSLTAGKAMGISKQPFQKRLDAAGKGLKGPSGSLGSGKKRLCPDPRQLAKPWALASNRSKSDWTLQGRVWRGQAAVLEAEKKALCRSPTAGKASGKTTGGKATGRCREGFEGAKRQSWKRKKRLCADPRQLAKPWEKKAVTDLRQLEKPLAFARNRSKGHLTLHVGNRKNELCADLRQLEKALAFSTRPFQRPFDAAGQGLGVGTGKKELCADPRQLGKPLAFAPGRCREGFEGARRRSWNWKEKHCADPRQLEKPWALASNRSKSDWTLQGRVWRGQAAVLEAEKKGSVQIPDSWQSHGH